MTNWLIKVNMNQGIIASDKSATIQYSYQSADTVKVLGVAQGVKEEIYYLMIYLNPGIFLIARCLETGTGLDIETWKIDATDIPFSSFAFEFSSEYNVFSVSRSDGITPPVYTLVNVEAATPYDLTGLATKYVDSTASKMRVLGLKVVKKTKTIVLLQDRTDWGFWLAQLDYASILLPTIKYISVLQS